MDAWERWWNMAQGSLKAAQELEVFGEHRSSVSRAYYAAYQAATALLLYARQIPPAGREAWSHEATPELVTELPGTILAASTAQAVRKRLSSLYDLRLIADYQSRKDVDELVLRPALRDAAFINKIANTTLPKKQS